MLATLSTLDIAVILATLAFAGVVKGSLGLGVPIVSIPVLASMVGLQNAVALISVSLILTNITQIWQFRQQRRQAGLMVPFLILAVVGIFVGTRILVEVDERVLFGLLGSLILAYIALVTVSPNIAVPPRLARRVAPVIGFFSGILQGATGISAPISLVFLHAMRWERGLFIFAVSVMFLVFGIVQLLSLTLNGVMTGELAMLSCAAAIPIMMFMPVGTALGRSFSTTVFHRLVLTVLGLLALRMLFVSLA